MMKVSGSELVRVTKGRVMDVGGGITATPLGAEPAPPATDGAGRGVASDPRRTDFDDGPVAEITLRFVLDATLVRSALTHRTVTAMGLEW